MNVDNPGPLRPEPLLGVRGKGFLKFALCTSISVPLFIVVTRSGAVDIPIVGKYLIILPGLPLTLALVGAVESFTGQPIATLSARWNLLSASKRRVISLVVVVIVIASIALVVVWSKRK